MADNNIPTPPDGSAVVAAGAAPQGAIPPPPDGGPALNYDPHQFAPYDQKTFGRYTTQEKYGDWAKTQPKTGADLKPGEYEAWSGANTPGGAKETLKNSATAVGEGAVVAGAALTGTAAIGAAAEAAPEVITWGLKKLAEQSPELFGHEAVKATIQKIAIAGMHKALIGGATGVSAVVAGKIWESLFGEKKEK